jgi:hypothetical protein
MSRKCGVCSHPDRADIDSVLIEGGASFRVLAQKYLLSADSLARHRRNHLAQEAEAKGIERGADLLARIRTAEEKLSGYERIAVNLATQGVKQGDFPLVLRALAEARRSAVESRMRLWDLELRIVETREIAVRLEEIERRIGEDQWVR